MKTIAALNILVFCLATGLFSCASQYIGQETDDLYYSSDDRRGIVKEQRKEPQRDTKDKEVQRETKVKETEPAKSNKNNYDFNSKP